MSGNIRRLDKIDRDILCALAEDGGFTAFAVANRSGLGEGNGRMRSAAMRSSLSMLEGRGLVRKMDAMKPICWVRTPEGTAAMRANHMKGEA